nr:uncharacterized protein LOC111424753 [Onthophagus taurus]XP_022914185.1 uncharacterized protein LOC111424753 [Onthophagus taurus]
MISILFNKCCCCSTKVGGQVWGMVHLAVSFCVLVMATVYLVTTEDQNEWKVYTAPIIACSVYAIFDVFLLIGLSRDISNMILAWLIWNGSLTICMLWYTLLIIITLIFTEPLLVLGGICPGVYLFVELYFSLIILSYYVEIKYPPGSVLYNPRRRRSVQQ